MALRDSEISTNITGRDTAVGVDMSPMTLAEEAAAGGWVRQSRPEGGTPQDAPTAGTR